MRAVRSLPFKALPVAFGPRLAVERAVRLGLARAFGARLALARAVQVDRPVGHGQSLAMDPILVPVHYDFASTICFVAHRLMERVELDDLGLELRWEPLDLGYMMGWPPGSPVEGPRRENAQRVANELGVELKLPGAWPASRPALAVALSLAGTPSEPAWRERIFCAVYEEGRDPGDPEELERFGRDLGVDVAAGRDPARIAELEDRTRAAAEDGVTGLPTFMLAGLPIGGIQEVPTMRRMLSRYAERQRES